MEKILELSIGNSGIEEQEVIINSLAMGCI
jgi:hypothetical protein